MILALLITIGLIVGFAIAILITILLQKLKKSSAERQAAELELAPVVELFSLTRYDVMDHVEAMKNSPTRFVMAPHVNERETDNLPDYLQCGERCFGVVFERNDGVHNIAVRLYSDTAEELGKSHTIEHATYLSGEDWYNLTIDTSFKNKREVYMILNASYDYIFKQYGLLDEEEARAELKQMEKALSTTAAMEVEKAAETAEMKYLQALEKFKADYYSDFKITRKEIIEDTKEIGNPDITIIERPAPQVPVSLKYKGKTYALLYGTDMGVIMVVKLYDEYADSLAVRHPQIRRGKFPAGANWYYVPVDGAFKDKKAVYDVLNTAYEFVLAKYSTASEADDADKLIYDNIAARETDEATTLKELEEFKAGYFPVLSRREIIEYTQASLNAKITVVERPMEPQLPTSLKYKGKTYAMLYGTEGGVVMVMKLEDDYAAELAVNNPGIGRTKFPAGPNWYYVPVNDNFETKEAVYTVLTNSIRFVDEFITRKVKQPRAPKKVVEKPKSATKVIKPKAEKIEKEKIKA